MALKRCVVMQDGGNRFQKMKIERRIFATTIEGEKPELVSGSELSRT